MAAPSVVSGESKWDREKSEPVPLSREKKSEKTREDPSSREGKEGGKEKEKLQARHRINDTHSIY